MEKTIDLRTSVTELPTSGVSWAAIAAGALAALALTLVLLWFGTGMGFSVVSPWSDSGVSATTFKIGTGLYLVVVAMISSAIGGHIAGRLRTPWYGIHSNETYFRDTAQGFLAWALASVVGALLLASAATTIIGSTAGGLSQGAGTAAGQSSGPMSGYVDQLLRPDPAAATVPAGDANDIRDELTRLLTSSFGTERDLKPADRTYVAQVVARRTALSQADAEKRVNDVVTQAKSDLDKARKAAAQLAFWMAASLLVGAFAASIAAAEAGAFRDRNWGTAPFTRE
ncbi:MAG TPA: hypothetical protein DEA80_00650 [Afipia sp.]|uniref:hypothetical protein n=1 Tax=unclassified Afipia TaxID=2642050 RepID=UPI00046614B8|nr:MULTISPECIES: hypothetical protein [unclassified Afipia]MAH72269.1 hypothetical protein [Afipia sp.]OUX58567.1 MAG: hypothetical protein CBB64_23960 [Afipia sp. TMED4]HAO42846.1 hypothetical protein [Afipia sp.]HAP12974.1 hypothetical protein [Afipia sp.]HBF53366.1 hypothetical protein [Afipia sp.]